MLRPIAVCSSAWQPAQNLEVVKLLKEFGVKGVEITPASINTHPDTITKAEAKEFSAFWKDAGIEICSMQGLFLNAPHTALFDGTELQEKLISYLTHVFAIAEILGSEKLIYSSFDNRKRGELTPEQAFDLAVPFFKSLGDLALSHGVQLCIGAAPAANGCDFITTSKEALELKKRVNHPGFGLHLDSAAMTVAGEDIIKAVKTAGSMIDHLHVNERDLRPIGSGSVDQHAVLAAINHSEFRDWVCIDLRDSGDLKDLEKSIKFVTDLYC